MEQNKKLIIGLLKNEVRMKGNQKKQARYHSTNIHLFQFHCHKKYLRPLFTP